MMTQFLPYKCENNNTFTYLILQYWIVSLIYTFNFYIIIFL